MFWKTSRHPSLCIKFLVTEFLDLQPHYDFMREPWDCQLPANAILSWSSWGNTPWGRNLLPSLTLASSWGNTRDWLDWKGQGTLDHLPNFVSVCAKNYFWGVSEGRGGLAEKQRDKVSHLFLGRAEAVARSHLVLSPGQHGTAWIEHQLIWCCSLPSPSWLGYSLPLLRQHHSS